MVAIAGLRGASRRLTLALAVSLLLHVWAMHDARGLRKPRVEAGAAAALTASLSVPAVDKPVARDVPALPAPAMTATSPAVHETPVPAAQPKATPPSEPSTTAGVWAAQGDAPLPQPSDPTYHGALSLDVYPRAITPLDLGAHLARAASGAVGEIRATVLIDEAGVVKDVRAIDAADPEIARAARTLLWQTRFSPARRDGRIVKAEVRVSLGYDKAH